jgi:hypothetical protein
MIQATNMSTWMRQTLRKNRCRKNRNDRNPEPYETKMEMNSNLWKLHIILKNRKKRRASYALLRKR